MRIAYLVNRYPAVSHSFIRREILALERQGHAIMRLSIRGWDELLQSEEDLQERTRTRYVLQGGALPLLAALVRTALSHPSQLARALGLILRLGRKSDRPLLVHFIYLLEACLISHWLRAGKIEHLHAHFGTNSAEVAMLVHELGGPSWSFTAHGPEEFDKAEFIGLPEKIRRAHAVAAVSSFGRSQLFRQVSHEHWPKIQVIHCGLEAGFHENASDRPADAQRLVCVGRLCEQKGQLLLLEAVQRLVAQGTKLELVLAGDGEMRPEIEALIARYKLQDVVHITGWISSDQVREELLAARALVLPSFAEGLPVVIMEAMALRRPVISTFVAGIPELIHSGEHGWLIPAGDIESLAAAIKNCLEQPPDGMTRMGNAARARVLERHDIEKEAAKLAALFQATSTRAASR